MNGKAWADWERAYLREIYPKFPTSVLAEIFRRSASSINGQAEKEKLHKSPEGCGWLRKGEMSPGCERAWYPKGHVPANKGTRRPGWAPGRMRDTQFKTGARSGMAAKNWKPVGTILADSEGYLRIKVREAVYGKEPFGFGNTKVWPLYNRYLWEKFKGPIPPKHIVAFKDGNRAHCVIENLELISMAKNAIRNRWGVPRELLEVVELNAALKRKIRNLDGQK